MALALTVQKNSDDYVLLQHEGEQIRISVNDSKGASDKAVIILMADHSEQAPHKGWLVLRKKVRERAGG